MVGSDHTFWSETEILSHDYPDKDVYRIWHRAANGFVSTQSIRLTAEARIEKFAERRGKSFVIIGEQTASGPHILGNFPKVEIIFALVPLKK